MAHTDTFDLADLQSVAEQVGERLPSIAPVSGPEPGSGDIQADPIPGAAPELSETFALCILGQDAIEAPAPGGAPAQGLEERVIQTDQRHHQIRMGGQAAAFARSTAANSSPTVLKDSNGNNFVNPPGAGGPEVMALFTSELAEQIDRGVDWIDQNVAGDPLVRLLVVPAYYVHALWLTEDGRDQVLVVDRPDSLTALNYQTLYDGADFLTLLAQHGPIQGLPDQLPPSGPTTP